MFVINGISVDVIKSRAELKRLEQDKIKQRSNFNTVCIFAIICLTALVVIFMLINAVQESQIADLQSRVIYLDQKQADLLDRFVVDY